jgi:hypothetical protein
MRLKRRISRSSEQDRCEGSAAHNEPEQKALNQRFAANDLENLAAKCRATQKTA